MKLMCEIHGIVKTSAVFVDELGVPHCSQCDKALSIDDTEKPPIGIIPEKLHNGKRMCALATKICDYLSSDMLTSENRIDLIGIWCEELMRLLKLHKTFF